MVGYFIQRTAEIFYYVAISTFFDFPSAIQHTNLRQQQESLPAKNFTVQFPSFLRTFSNFPATVEFQKSIHFSELSEILKPDFLELVLCLDHGNAYRV
jgi:sporulation-control protein spo0M